MIKESMLRDKTEVRILGNTKIRRKDSESEFIKEIREEARKAREKVKKKKKDFTKTKRMR